MRELARSVEQWRQRGQRAALVRAVEVKGFGAGQYDNALVRSTSGETAGAILRGISEGSVNHAVAAVLDDPEQTARQLLVSVSDPEAAAGGLSCGGAALLVVEAVDALPAQLWQDLAAGRPLALATRIDGDAPPVTTVIADGGSSGSLGDPTLDDRIVAAGRELLADPRSNRVTLEQGPARVVIEKIVARTRVLAVGGGEVVDALVDVTAALGWLFEPLGDDDDRSGRPDDWTVGMLSSSRRIIPDGVRQHWRPACAATPSSSAPSARAAPRSVGPRRWVVSAWTQPTSPASMDRSAWTSAGALRRRRRSPSVPRSWRCARGAAPPGSGTAADPSTPDLVARAIGPPWHGPPWTGRGPGAGRNSTFGYGPGRWSWIPSTAHWPA